MKYLKLILAALMLLCLFDMPYGYYQFVRFVSMVAFGWMAFEYHYDEKPKLAYIFGALALLFQPFFKVALGRGGWNAMDVVAAVGLVCLWWMERKSID